MLWEGLDCGLDDAIEGAWQAINDHVGHPDLHEGSRAFVEKRRPKWAPYTD